MTSTSVAAILNAADPKALAVEILRVLRYRLGKDASVATNADWLVAAIKVVRDRIIDQWIESTKEDYDRRAKRCTISRASS